MMAIGNRISDIFGGRIPTLTANPDTKIHFQLPNLRILSISAGTAPDFHVSAEIQNDGEASTRTGFALSAVITIFDFHRSYPPVPLSATSPPLEPGDVALIHLGVVPNVPEYALAKVCVIVDPPSAGHPGGMIWESNESDNTFCEGFFTSQLPRFPHVQAIPDMKFDKVPPHDPNWANIEISHTR